MNSPSCPVCNGTTWKAMTNGMSVRCHACCTHSQGFYVLSEALHNRTEQKWASCINGCGYTLTKEEYDNETRT